MEMFERSRGIADVLAELQSAAHVVVHVVIRASLVDETGRKSAHESSK